MDKYETMLREIGETKDTEHGERITAFLRELRDEILKHKWIATPQGYREIDCPVVDVKDIDQVFTNAGVPL